MALWRIKCDSRQTECCGEPFSAGDEVRWRLVLRAVGTCPKWFSSETRPGRHGRGCRRDGTGVLAELETPGGPASARPGQ